MSVEMKTDPSIDYSKKMSSHSSPLFVKLSPINNIVSFNPSLTSVYGPVEWVIPARALNLSRSKLSWDLTVPAQAASTFAFIQGNALTQLDRLVITSQSTNQVLLDIPNLNRYVSMLSPVFTSQQELAIKASPISTNNPASAAASVGAITVIPALYTSAASGQSNPCENVSQCNSSNNADGLGKDYGKPFGNVIRKVFVSSAAATDNYVSFELDLNSIPASILDQDKLLYFSGESLVVSIYWAPVNRYCWGGTSATNPVTGATAATGTFVVSNPNIYLYVEQNIDIIKSLTDKVMSEGISINFPYSFIQRQTATSGSGAITSQLSRGYGQRLLFAAVSIFNPTETGNTAQDHSVQALISSGTGNNGNYSNFSYNTQLNNIPIMTNNNISIIGSGTQNAEQWLYNKSKLYNSALSSLPAFNCDFVHLDSFIGPDSLCNADLTVLDGLDLASNQTYSFVYFGTSGTSVTHNIYLVFSCQKTLNLTPSGIVIN
jgi:hypothetical protein